MEQKLTREELIALAIIDGKKDEKIIRYPNQLNGVDMNISNLKNCEIQVLDITAQILIDNCVDCKFVIGPCGGSVFARDCNNCEIRAISKQIRTRDCSNIKFYIHLPTQPSIESSEDIKFGKWNVLYPKSIEQLKKQKFKSIINKYDKIHDFTPKEETNNWSIISEEESAKEKIEITLDEKYGNPEDIYTIKGEIEDDVIEEKDIGITIDEKKEKKENKGWKLKCTIL